MTGFLHRLAQRANGSARVVRVAATPWSQLAGPARDQELVPEPTVPQHHGAPSAAGPQATQPADRTGTVAPAFADPQPHDIRPLPTQAAPARRPAGTGATDATPQTAPPQPVAGHDRPARANRPLQQVEGATATRQPAPAAMPSPPHAPSTGREPPPDHPAGFPADAGRHGASRQTTVADGPRPRADADRMPPWLVTAPPPHAAHRPPAPVQQQAAPLRMPSSAPAETTEVHVHIGRIEVTALQQQPPAPRKAPRAGRAPLSLDAYLARRRGAEP